MIDIVITGQALDLSGAYERAITAGSGCVNLFVGTVREKTDGKQVVGLEFEAYEEMAIKEMRKIANEARSEWAVNNIVIYHRTGKLNIGDLAVIIAASAAHRRDAIKASHFIIDKLKATVPIWKKEIYVDGAEWVWPHP